MGAGTEVFNQVINQQGSPALFSAILADRPAFGYVGRIFISTNTREIYRDTGTSWELIGSGGGSVNIYNSNGTLTGQRTVNQNGNDLIFTGGRIGVGNAPVGYLDVRPTFSASQPVLVGFMGLIDPNPSFGTSGWGFETATNNNRLGTLRYTEQNVSRYSISFNAGSGVNYISTAIGNIGEHTFFNSTTQVAKFTNTNRFLLGTNVDAGFLADFQGGSSRFIRTTVSNSGVQILSSVGGVGGLSLNGTTPVSNEITVSQQFSLYQSNSFSTQGAALNFGSAQIITTTGSAGLHQSAGLFQSTSGNATLYSASIRPTFNLSGTYAGTLIGLWYNPVLNSIASGDHIAIQTELGRCNFLETQAAAVSGRANYSTFSRLTQDLAAGGSVGGGSFYTGAALLNVSNFAGAYTFGSASINGGGYSGSTMNFSAAGTVTMNQAGLRTFAGHQIFNQFGGSASGTISHFAGMQILGLYNQNTGVITPSITNAYGLVINNLNDYSHTFTLANRWGIYQTGPIDHNYFAGKLLTGTTVVTPRQVHIGGDMEFTTTASATHGGASGLFLNVWVNGTQYKIELRNV